MGARTQVVVLVLVGLGLVLMGCGGGSGGGVVAVPVSGTGGASTGSAVSNSTGGASSTATAPASGSASTSAPDSTAPTFAADAASGPNTFHTGTATLGGTADDAGSGVKSVTVNGAFAILGGTPQSSTWQAQMSLRNGVNTLLVEVTDNAGNKSSGWWNVFYAERYLDAAKPVSSAGIVYVTDTGFAALSTMVTDYLRRQNVLVQALLNQAITIPNPITGVGTMNFSVSRASFDPPTVALSPTATGILANVVLTNVAIDTTSGINVRASRIDVAVNIRVTVSNGTYSVSVAQHNGRPAVSASFQGLRISGIPSFLTSVFTSAITSIVQNAIGSSLPPALQAALNSLTPSYSQTLLGVTFTASAEPSAINYSTQGVEIVVDSNITSNKTGSSGAPGSLGLASHTAPTFSQNHDVNGAANVEMVNRATYAAWESGLLKYTIDQQTLTQLGVNLPIQIDGRWLALFFPQLNSMITNPSQPVPIGLQLAADLPPSVTFNTQTPNLQAGFGGLHAGVVMDFGAGYSLVLGLRVSVEAAANLSTSGNALDVTIAQPTTIMFDLAAAGNPLNFNIQNVNNFVNMGLSQAITLLGGLIPSVPVNGIPAFGNFPGIQFQSVEAGVDSPSYFVTKVKLK
ncbi:hypothetical protein ACFL59_05075 [Planctomycetota bacterium]